MDELFHHCRSNLSLILISCEISMMMMIHQSRFRWDNFRFLKLLYFGQFQIGICLDHSQVKRHENASFHICVFLKFFLPTPYSQEDIQYIHHQFAYHFSLTKYN